MGVVIDILPRLKAVRYRRALDDLKAISARIAERRIRESERHVEQQRQIVADLRASGRHVDRAEILLAELHDVLRERREYLVGLRREMEEDTPWAS